MSNNQSLFLGFSSSWILQAAENYIDFVDDIFKSRKLCFKNTYLYTQNIKKGHFKK